MIKFGYRASAEQFGTGEIVKFGCLAVGWHPVQRTTLYRPAPSEGREASYWAALLMLVIVGAVAAHQAARRAAAPGELERIASDAWLD
jgi:hypothetical protein